MTQIDQIIADALAGSPETHVAILAREVVRLRGVAPAVVVPELTDDEIEERYRSLTNGTDELEREWCRIRITPRTTKAIATRATVICGTPDGARTSNAISRESGLTEYDCERIHRAWDDMQVSTAKYIMLEIQREGEQ